MNTICLHNASKAKGFSKPINALTLKYNLIPQWTHDIQIKGIFTVVTSWATSCYFI
jgi:hypothetical protein